MSNQPSIATKSRKAGHPWANTGRVLAAATVVFKSEAAASRYMTTANFALGGATPLEVLKRPGGEAAVIGELQTQDEAGPVQV